MKIALSTRCGVLLAAFALLWLTGCDSTKDTTCGPGTEQVARSCVPIADSSLDGSTSDASGACGEGTFERDGECLPRQPIGGPCTSGPECLSDTCLKEDRGAVDGYCTITSCSSQRPCPSGSHCRFVPSENTALCLAYCDGDENCRVDEGNYACQPLYTTDINICSPSCAKKDSCSSGTVCDKDSGKCVIHECIVGALDACLSDEDAGVSQDMICYADTMGLSSTGGICLPRCDPKEPSEVCASNEVCQPLAADPINTGFCAPPVCQDNEDCPAGALCVDNTCMPPLPCEEDGSCTEDGKVCVSGNCMPECPSEGECQDLHSGLRCESTNNACLPVGAFPGGECHNVLDAPCDPLSVRREDGSTEVAEMICAREVCLPTCADGGNALCRDISAELVCAPAGIVADAPVCLPSGSFPGGPCGDEDACDPLEVGENSIPMMCADDKCLITCSDADGGDVVCAAIDASLQCVAGLFPGSDVCVPRGSYPGGPCAPGNTCDAGFVCEQDMCLFECEDGGTALCESFSDTLACAVGIFSTPVCLPKGSYPGGPCGAENACAENLNGLGAADMFCSGGVCLLQCESTGPFANGDGLCSTVDPSLTCVTTPTVDFCMPACVGGACPTGMSCLAPENACLPTGSFLGSPCAAGDTCPGEPDLKCVPGETPVCLAGCDVVADPSAPCQSVGTTFGTGYDACLDVDPGAGELLICGNN